MKKTKLSLAIAGLVLAGAIIATSCKKSTTTTTQNNDTTSATDNNTSETASKDLMNIGSEAIDNGSLTTYKLAAGQGNGGALSPMNGSVTINVDSLSYKKITVTFVGFVGYDNVTRNGTIKYDWSGSTNGAVYFKDAGFYVAVTTPLNDYKVNGNLVTINKKHVRNLGLVNGNYTWSDTANLVITKVNNGGTITWNRTGNMVLLNTNATTYPTVGGSSIPGVYPTSSGGFIDWTKALIGFNGSASGTTATGSSYTANISQQVVYNLYNCAPISTYPYFHPPVAGQIDFTPQGLITRSVNYGNGTCDATFTIIIGSWSASFSFI